MNLATPPDDTSRRLSIRHQQEGLSLEAADKEAIGSTTPVRSPQAQDAVAFVSTSVL